MSIEKAIARVRNELELFKEVSSTRFSGFAYDVENVLDEVNALTKERDEMKERLKGIEKVYKKYEGMVPAKESLIYSTFAVVTLMDLWQAIKNACEVKE